MQHEKVIIAPPDKLQTVKGKTLADKYFFTYAECRSPSMAAEIVRRYNAWTEMKSFIEAVAGLNPDGNPLTVIKEAQTILNKLK